MYYPDQTELRKRTLCAASGDRCSDGVERHALIVQYGQRLCHWYALVLNMKVSDMNEINEEIKQTINAMQCDIDDGAHSEMQYHLKSLLEIKRNELQQRLVERSWFETVTHDQEPIKSVKLDGKIADEAKPLTAEELKAGWWWCTDVSEECCSVLLAKGVSEAVVFRSYLRMEGLKQIHRIGNEFYWGEV